MHVFSKSGGHFAANPVTQGSAIASIGTSSPGGMPGGILSLSANGTSNAILWANEAAGSLPSDPDSNIAPIPNILRAYDVSTVGSGTLQSIWDSETEPNDRVGAATKFAPPLVANGKVYQATYDNQVVVYSLGAASSMPVSRHSPHGGLYLWPNSARPGYVRPWRHQGRRPYPHTPPKLVESAHQRLSLGRRVSRLEWW